MSHTRLGLLLPCLVALGCAQADRPARQFPLTGEILAIKTDRTEVTVKHDEVRDFMPAMTMPFTIKEPAQLDGLAPGDLISATLVLTDEDSYLTAIRKTGTVPPSARGALPIPRETALQPGHPVPELVLTADDGNAASLAALRGSLVLFTFVYTRCPLPDYCPRMDTHFKAIQDAVMRDARLAGRVRLLSISFDPDFDTPARLRDHATRVGAHPAVWQYVTASRQAVEAFGASFGLTVQRDGADGSNITHNLRTVLVGRDGMLAKTYNGSGWVPSEVVTDLVAQTARH